MCHTVTVAAKGKRHRPQYSAGYRISYGARRPYLRGTLFLHGREEIN